MVSHPRAPSPSSPTLPDFVVGALAGVAGTSAVVALVWWWWRGQRVDASSSSSSSSPTPPPLLLPSPAALLAQSATPSPSPSSLLAAVPAAAAPPPAPLDTSELLAEQLSRNRQFFGDEGQARIQGAHVVVVGLGGVGSHAAHMLARAGVGRLRLIDFDNVTLSSLNRHAVATRQDVGTPKVAALARALRAIVPSCEVEAVQALFSGEYADALLAGRPDWVLDCIDDKDTKTDLLAYCVGKGIRVLASLGAGGKADPTRIKIADLTDVRHDPLGAVIRMELRKRGVAALDMGAGPGKPTKGGGGAAAAAAAAVAPPFNIPCVYSSESVRVKLLPLDLDASAGETPDDFGALPGFRVRVLPVLGTMPALFGQTMAAHTLCALAQTGFDLTTEALSAPSTTPTALTRLYRASSALDKGRIPVLRSWGYSGGVGMEEAGVLNDDVWHQRSAISGERQGGRGVVLVLVRWRPWRGAVPSNTVLLTEEEADAHIRAVLGGGDGEGGGEGGGAGAAAAPPVDVHGLVEAAAATDGGAAEARAELEAHFRRACVGSGRVSEEVFERVEARLRRVREDGWA
jgi:tRNA A37 threonylcarbamoyladenosine dehydratase